MTAVHNQDSAVDVSAVTATTDLHGATLAIGTRVRSFDFPGMSPEGAVTGLDLEGERACFYEGVIESIGTESFEGAPRYRIAADRRVFGGSDEADNIVISPPVNGLSSMLSPGVTFGVVAL